jgi:hypothetical protein
MMHLFLESSFSERDPILLRIDRLDNDPAAQHPAKPGGTDDGNGGRPGLHSV